MKLHIPITPILAIVCLPVGWQSFAKEPSKVAPATSVSAERTPVVVLCFKGGKGKREGSVALLDPDTYEQRTKTEVGGFPSSAIFSPDGLLLYVLNQGLTGKKKSLSVINLATGEESKRLPVGNRIKLSRKGRKLYYFDVAKPKKPVNFTTVNLESFTESGKVIIPPSPIMIHEPSDGNVLHILHGSYFNKKVDSRLTTIGTDDLKIRNNLLLGEEFPTFRSSKDGEMLYLFGGQKEKKQLWIIKASTGALRHTIDLGRSYFILSDEGGSEFDIAVYSESEGASVFRGFRSGEITKEKTFSESRGEVVMFGPQRSTLLVFLTKPVKHVLIRDLIGQNIDRTIFVQTKPEVGLLRGDGRWLYVKASGGSKVSFVDLEAGKEAATLTAGRAGIKVAKVLGQVALAGLGILYIPARGFKPMLLGPDERFLYVVNTKSNDLTIMDTNQLNIVKKVGTGKGSRVVVRSPKGHLILAVGQEKVSFFDTETHKMVQSLERAFPFLKPGPLFSPEYGVYFRPNREEVLILKKSGLSVLSLSTHKAVADISMNMPFRLVLPGVPNTAK